MGVISTQSGEFIVPYVPIHTIIPLSPHIALVGLAPDGVITEQNLFEIVALCGAVSERIFLCSRLLEMPDVIEAKLDRVGR